MLFRKDHISLLTAVVVVLNNNVKHRLHVWVEGNPVWSNPDYSHQLVSCLPSLATLDQQEVSPELRAVARRWAELRQQQPSRQPSPTGDKAVEKSKALLYKKLEERNASISNAKFRWKILKTKTLVNSGEESPGEEAATMEDTEQAPAPEPRPDIRCSTSPRAPPPAPPPAPASEPRPEVQIKVEVPSEAAASSRGAIPKIITRQLSERTLVRPSLAVTPPQPAPPPHRPRPGAGAGAELDTAPPQRKISAPAAVAMPPPPPIRDSAIRIKFPGLERRKFALPQRYETLNDSDESQRAQFTRSNSLQDLNDKQKIGFFTVVPRKVGGQGESSSTCQSDDEDISGDFLSDSATTSDSDTDSEEGEGGAAFPSSHAHRGQHRVGPQLDKSHARGRSLVKNLATASRSSSQFSEERGPAHTSRAWSSLKTGGGAGASVKGGGGAGGGYRKKASEAAELSGRTSEQGKDYLIELDGDLLR